MRKPFGAAESAAKFGILEEMAKVLDIEIEALQCVRQQLSSEFEEAVKTFAACTGQIIVTGVGKSGIIATKIAATLRSTGTAATFLHAGEALHGDIGMVGPTDVVLAVGKSGETSELNILLRFLKKSGARIISLTSNESSSMAKLSDIVLNLHVPRFLNVLFYIEPRIAEGRGCLRSHCAVSRRNFSGRANQPQSLTATAGHGL